MGKIVLVTGSPNRSLPRSVLTRSCRSVFWRPSPWERGKIAETTLLKRPGTPEAVARACLYLAKSSDYSTGAELAIDGGRLIA